MPLSLSPSLLMSSASSVAFSPLSLFAAGEQGAWYDPSDLSTMFQDTAGTTPVTATGQTVARINDKSGRGNHATQATAASRPIYQVDGNGKAYLLFDGTDDFLLTGTITPGIDKAQVFAGVRVIGAAAGGMVLETSVDIGANNGALNLVIPNASPFGGRGFRSKGTVQGTADTANNAYTAPITQVLTGVGDIAGDTATLRVNGTQAATSATDQGTGNYLAYPLYIGRRAGTSLPFNGRIYSLLVRFGANLSAATITQTETFVNSRTGAY